MTKHDEIMSEFDHLVRSNRPFIYLVSHEETRVAEAIRTVATNQTGKTWNMLSWDLATGLVCECGTVDVSKVVAADQISVLEWFYSLDADESTFTVLLLKDFHKLLGAGGHPGQVEHRVNRLLRNMCTRFVGRRKCVVMLSPNLYLPEEFERVASVIDWPLPERDHISRCVVSMLSDAAKHPELSKQFKTTYGDDEINDVVGAFQGMTHDQIVLLSAYIMLRHSEFTPGVVSTHKRDIIRKSTVLEWIEPEMGLDAVGGLDNLKEWIESRKGLFGPEAKQANIPTPKGLLLFGVQGCGKSTIIKCIGKDFGLPILRMDMGRIYQGLVGGSEQNIRNALQMAEAVAPCVLWTDEIDKGVSGHRSSGSTDGGTTARVFSTFLTWMQEKTAPVFLLATANDISALPPEFIRKGRFDEIFFVDLPSVEERRQIVAIHAQIRGIILSTEEVEDIVASSTRFTGAEIEAAIAEGMVVAFNDGRRKVTANDVIRSMEKTVPLSTMMNEEMGALREWAELRARPASKRMT